jgi:four helix bundle protein
VAAIEKFEDLIAWQKSKAFAVKIYSATDEGKFSKDFGLRDQIRRASISIVSNIAEGFERKGNKEFLQFLFYSLGSIAEVKTQLIISFELNYISKEKYDELNDLLVDIQKITKGLVAYLKESDLKGSKFIRK